MEMLAEKHKMAFWNVYGFCYVKLIIFFSKKVCFPLHKCISAFRWEIQEVKCFTNILAPNQWVFSSILVGKHCIPGDSASSDMLIWNVSFHYIEITQEKVQQYVPGIWTF